MKAIAAIILMAALSGCGRANPDDVKFTDYHISLFDYYNGAKAVSSIQCADYLQRVPDADNTLGYSFFYERINYSDGNAYVSCGATRNDKGKVTAQNGTSYFSSETGVTDGSCSVVLSDGTFSYSISGTRVSASATGSADVNGWAVTLSNCSGS